MHCRTRSFGWVFVKGISGILCFLIVVVLAKILTNFTPPDGLFQQAAEGILFANFWLLLLITIVLFIADIFGSFPFPLNLPAPIIRAFGSVFCIAFVASVFQWVDSVWGTTLYQFFWVLAFIIVPLVFLIVLATGYLEIVRKLRWQPRIDTQQDGQVVHESPVYEQADKPVRDAKSWDEIGAEFRMMLFDILHRFR